MTWRGLLGAYSEQIKQREVKSQNKPCATLKTFSDYYSQDLNALVFFKLSIFESMQFLHALNAVCKTIYYTKMELRRKAYLKNFLQLSPTKIYFLSES